jgi:translation initiation factor 4E
MEHPLATEWAFFLFCKTGANPPDDYEANIHPIGSFNTLEGFWALYSHLKRPLYLEAPADYHLFRKGIRGIWEDKDNVQGGKWMIRLKREFASYYWERLIMALIGEQFPLDVVGAVISVRYAEHIISLWNRTASSPEVIHSIVEDLRQALDLPVGCLLEYKRHDDSVKDGSSFRNTVHYQVGSEALELQAKRSAGRRS